MAQDLGQVKLRRATSWEDGLGIGLVLGLGLVHVHAYLG